LGREGNKVDERSCWIYGNLISSGPIIRLSQISDDSLKVALSGVCSRISFKDVATYARRRLLRTALVICGSELAQMLTLMVRKSEISGNEFCCNQRLDTRD